MVGASAESRQGGGRAVGSKGEEFGGADQRGCCQRACLGPLSGNIRTMAAF